MWVPNLLRTIPRLFTPRPRVEVRTQSVLDKLERAVEGMSLDEIEACRREVRRRRDELAARKPRPIADGDMNSISNVDAMKDMM